MPELIDVRLAVQQEIRTRNHFALIMLVAATSLLIVSGAVLYGLHLPVTVLALMVLMYFFVQNRKEIERLKGKYGL